MKLQVALDGDLESSLSILRVIRPYIDIAEIGTPLIFREGLGAIRVLHKAFPDLSVLADLKIMDAGEHEATLAFEAGCDLVTVLGVASNSTIQGTLNAAKRFDKKIMVDMMQVSAPIQRSRELLKMGCDYLCIHTAYDLQASGTTPLANLAQLREALPDAPLAVAGGIGPDTLDSLCDYQPSVVIVGGKITNSSNPTLIAQTIRTRLDQA